MNARRYESGRLVEDKRAQTPALGWGQKDNDAPARIIESAEMQKPAVVERRPPPTIPAYAPGTIEADSALSAVAQTLADAASTHRAAAEADSRSREIATAPSADKPDTVTEPPKTVDEEITDTSNMRKFLLKQMVRASKGEITTETVKNIVTLSQQVYNATSLELKAAAIVKSGEKSIRALELVSPQDLD